MESGLPPALENEWLLRKRHLLGQTCSHSDSAESREDLCDPVHAECSCYVPGKGGAGTICIRQSPCGMFADTPPLHFSMEHLK